MKNKVPKDQPEREPWQDVKGKCRTISISTWESDGRRFYGIWIPGRKPPRYVTTNRKNVLDLANILADVPPTKAPALSELSTESLCEIAAAVENLRPILGPLNIPINTGIDEYARIKARTGKQNLDELFDGLLAACPSAEDLGNLRERLREIGGAVGLLARVLTPLKISITSGIEEYVAVKTQAGNKDLRELFKEILSRPWIARSRTRIDDVVNQFLDSCKNESEVSDDYYQGLYYSLAALVDAVGASTPIGDVTTAQLKPIVFRSNRKKRSNKSKRGHILTFFHWCRLNQYLDYLQPTAADALAKIRAPRTPPHPLKPAESKAMLTALQDIWCLLYLALSLFTGIRNKELQRLRWDMIKDNVLDIPAHISKTGKRRIIWLHPALRAWLAPFRGRSGFVMPIVIFQAKTTAFLKNCGDPGVPPKWLSNWLRDSFCSYRLAETGKVLDTAEEDGHKAYILEQVYLKLSTKREARKHFELSPKLCGKPNWNTEVKLIIKDIPDVLVRKCQTRPWKKIGNGLKTTVEAGNPSTGKTEPRSTIHPRNQKRLELPKLRTFATN